ncbi:MAG TPA: ribosome biogenesis GTPase Der [Xanthobacteraceae bacterium]|nr:ribosome biogenesis GTPase Der [Xanthobacteraceae bacterium]
MLPTVAVVGRPNVGKSTLFNRLIGKRIALVDDRPGVTRDRREGEARLGGLAFRVIDTAGFEEAADESLKGRMRAQTEAAIAEADAVLFVLDARAGILPDDRAFADELRRAAKPVIVVANKSESKAGEAGYYEAFELGLGEPVAISAEHNEGMADLYGALREVLAREPVEEADADAEGESTEAEDAARPLRTAVVGRPNSGKSTLINALIGEERLVTGPEAGITRDSIAVDFEHSGRRFELYDTAGLRRRGRVEDKLERLSVADALRAIRFAEIVILLLDATHPWEEQDLRIADVALKEGRALVIGMNKCDLVPRSDIAPKKLREEADHWLPQARGMPVVPVSGKTGEGLNQLIEAAVEVYGIWNRRASTAALNRWLRGVIELNSPPAVTGKTIKLRYITQPKARPPSFVLFGTRTSALPDSYTRYLVNSLRETFGLPGVPIRLAFRESDNPFAERK